MIYFISTPSILWYPALTTRHRSSLAQSQWGPYRRSDLGRSCISRGWLEELCCPSNQFHPSLPGTAQTTFPPVIGWLTESQVDVEVKSLGVSEHLFCSLTTWPKRALQRWLMSDDLRDRRQLQCCLWSCASWKWRQMLYWQVRPCRRRILPLTCSPLTSILRSFDRFLPHTPRPQIQSLVTQKREGARTQSYLTLDAVSRRSDRFRPENPCPHERPWWVCGFLPFWPFVSLSCRASSNQLESLAVLPTSLVS